MGSMAKVAMNQNPELHNYSEDEIDIRELFAVLWRGKWIILLMALVFAVGGISYAFYKPNVYTASALLAPANDDSSGHIGGQLAGLASLAGVNIGEGNLNKTVIAREVLKSRAFLGSFIRRHNLAVPLAATKDWDMVREQWVIDTDIFRPETSEWSVDDNGKSLAPTDWELVEEFRELLHVGENRDTGMLTVSITFLSPVAVKKWVELLIKDLNDHMREQDVAEAEASIQYLESKLKETNIAGMQQVLYQLIESQTRTIMLANAQQEYVFKTIDPAVVPEEKSAPKRALISVAAIMLGGTLGIFIIFLQAFIRAGRENATKKQISCKKIEQ